MLGWLLKSRYNEQFAVQGMAIGRFAVAMARWGERMPHKFKIGQLVDYHPPPCNYVPRGPYLIVAQLPSEMETLNTRLTMRMGCTSAL
jgi:hypothetical protein